jgi:hypothetical protein
VSNQLSDQRLAIYVVNRKNTRFELFCGPIEVSGVIGEIPDADKEQTSTQ